MSNSTDQPDAQIGLPLVSTPERDRGTGRFVPGNRAAARRPEIGRDATRKAHRRNRDLAGMITEQVTQAQVKAHVRRLSKIIQEGDDREALAAFKLLYGRVSDPGRPQTPPAPALPPTTTVQLPVPPEFKYNG